MFEALPNTFSYAELEEEVLSFWQENNIFQQSLQQREGATPYSFYEGPPTVNGRPGIHHIIARMLKDMMCRYKTMTGHYVYRKAGWDTHGLPVEIAVEKQLKLKDKQEIDALGVRTFNEECRKLVYSNIDNDQGWNRLTSRMGYWLDLNDPYITCTNDYVESVWWALQQFFNKGLIYRGFRIVPQSPTIETPLSSHELSQAYKTVRDPNCYIKLKIREARNPALTDAELLVWTTTPWTLISNVALAVGEDIDYVLVRNMRSIKRKDTKVEEHFTLVLAEARLAALDGEYTILERFKGKDLLGVRYEQIFPYVKIDTAAHPNALSILPGDFVTTDDGSGIVHLAPAFGQDDYEMSKTYNLPLVQPVSPGGRFTAEAGVFAGRTVKTFTYLDRTEEGADKDIVIALKKADKIYRSTNDYEHSYPHCWRTDNPVIYYARESWFIRSSQYKERMSELNATIRWQPPEIGSGRFGNWLEDVKDWSLSRDRYWGTPLPIWVSEDGADMFAVGSVAELESGLYEHEDGTRVPVKECGVEIDLHRPFVDQVVFERGGKTYRRTPETIDVWFDSGSMPFAQWHYPFENKEKFDNSFPADFIAEGIDQTRGWFYTLHNIATVIFDKPAFKSIIVNEMILDKDGHKMSKSRGNTVDPFEIMDTLGADAVRFYLLVNNPPWKPTLFNTEDIRNTVIADFFRSLTNMYAFFALYANIDGFDAGTPEIAVAERPEIDRWILSRFNSVLQEYADLMESFEITRAMRLLQDFAINDVSNWYVRRNRRRFWKGEVDSEKIAAYQTLRTVLMGLLAMLAPSAPFLPDYLYRRLRATNDPVSIHLTDMPGADESLIDRHLEQRMAAAQTIVFVARSLREKSKIRTRQPLRRILIPVTSPQQRRDIQAVENIIAEEINIKRIEYVGDDTGIVKKSAKPDFKVIGKKFGKHTKFIAGFIRQMDESAIRELERTGSLRAVVGGEELLVTPEDVEVVHEDIEGWLVSSHNGTTVALDTELDKDLINEGIAREFVNRIQNLRKDSGFDVTDRIRIQFSAADELGQAVEAQREYICDETLCTHLERVNEMAESTTLSINDRDITVKVARIEA